MSLNWGEPSKGKLLHCLVDFDFLYIRGWIVGRPGNWQFREPLYAKETPLGRVWSKTPFPEGACRLHIPVAPFKAAQQQPHLR